MLFSRVKISCFRPKAHLVFHWCLYNKTFYVTDDEDRKVDLNDIDISLKVVMKAV